MRLVGAATVDGEDAHTAESAGPLEVGCNLKSELAGRADDEGLGATAITFEVDSLQERNAEAEGFSGAGLGLADEVLTLEGQGEAHLLDRKGALDAIGEECCGDLWIGAEFSKCRCCCRIDA